MDDRRAELLDDVAVKIARMATAATPPMSEAEARRFGQRVADMLAEDWGGSSVYIPKDLARRFRRRDASIYAEYTGANIDDLARKYGLTPQRIYAIIKAERRRRASRQLSLIPDFMGRHATIS